MPSEYPFRVPSSTYRTEDDDVDDVQEDFDARDSSPVTSGRAHEPQQQQQEHQHSPAVSSSTAGATTHEIKLTSRDKDVRKAYNLGEGGKVLLSRASSTKSGPGGLSDGLFRCPVMSKAHAELRVRHGIVYVTDVGSLHGTHLNGLALSENVEKAIKDGDKLSLGKTVIKSGIRSDALVLDVSIQTNSSRIVPPLTPPTPQKMLVSTSGDGEASPGLTAQADAVQSTESAGLHPVRSLHSTSHGRYGLSKEAAEGDLDVEEVPGSAGVDVNEVGVVSVRSRSSSQSVDDDTHPTGPRHVSKIEVVEEMDSIIYASEPSTPESDATSGFGDNLEQLRGNSGPPDDELSRLVAGRDLGEVNIVPGQRAACTSLDGTNTSGIAFDVGDTHVHSPVEMILEGAPPLATNDTESDLARTDRDFRSPRPGLSSEDEPATSSCIRRLSSSPIAEAKEVPVEDGELFETKRAEYFADAIHDVADNDEVADADRAGYFAEAIDDVTSSVDEDEDEDEIRDASAAQHEPEILWRQASPSDRQAALCALRLSRDRRKLSQRSAASQSPKQSEAQLDETTAAQMTDRSSNSAGSPLSYASLDSLNDLFPAVDFEAVAAGDDVSTRSTSGSSAIGDDDVAANATLSVKSPSLVEGSEGAPLLPRSRSRLAWTAGSFSPFATPSPFVPQWDETPIGDVSTTAVPESSRSLSQSGVESPAVNPWISPDEPTKTSGNPTVATSLKRRRESADEDLITSPKVGPSLIKTASVQAVHPALISRATSTEPELLSPQGSGKVVKVKLNVDDDDAGPTASREPIVSTAVSPQAVSMPFERIFAVPEAAVVQAAALQAVESPAVSECVSTSSNPALLFDPVAMATAAVAANPVTPEVTARPAKRARLGTFLVGVLAGSALSIGALASYGAGDLA